MLDIWLAVHSAEFTRVLMLKQVSCLFQWIRLEKMNMVHVIDIVRNVIRRLRRSINLQLTKAIVLSLSNLTLTKLPAFDFQWVLF